MNVRMTFEDELRRRGLPFTIDGETGRHVVETGGRRVFVSLDNLQREVAVDGDFGRVSRFVDVITASSNVSEAGFSASQLYWCLERSDYEEKADYRVAISDVVDRVLVHLSPDGSFISWVTPKALETMGLSETDAFNLAFANLERALSEASLESADIDGVLLGFIATTLPFKSSLILAPNLREVVGDVLGWPLMAIVPDRGFLYLWAARHADFVPRVGQVVVREYLQAAYPISTEVYEISDQSIVAIGAFPTDASPER